MPARPTSIALIAAGAVLGLTALLAHQWRRPAAPPTHSAPPPEAEERVTAAPREPAEPKRAFVVVDEEGVPVDSALLLFYGERTWRRWKTWTPDESSFPLRAPNGRVRAFSAPPASASASAEDRYMSEYASDIVSFSPGTTAQSNQDPIELVIRRRQGIVGVVPASTEPPWAQQFQMFAHRLDGTSPPVRDETWRYGLRTKAEPYIGDGVYFLLTDVPAGTYVVGIRYPDAVVRETTTVEVGEGLHKAKLAVSTPAEHEVLRVCCTDHLGRRADDMSFRLETMVRDSSAEDLHTIDDAIVHPSGLGHYEIDLRWLPRRFRLAGSHPGPDHAAWIHATSTDRGQRVLRLREALGRSAVPQVGGKPRATLRLAPTRNVDLQIMETRGLSSYEVLAYMERSGVNGEGLGPIRDPFLRATAIPAAEKDIDRSTARIRLPESEPMTLVVREARPGVWLKPIDFVRRSMRIEPDPDCLPSSDRMQILVNAPPHRDLAVHVASARLRPVAIGLEAQMPDRRWRLIMTGHAADGSPLKVAALPHGAYRIKTYATGTYTTFELRPGESGPQIVTLSPTP